jgi:exodeoxyribonuclease-3
MPNPRVVVAAPFPSDMKIVTWNVNSIRARIEHLLQFLQYTRPDIVLLQETKTQDAGFPFEPIEDLGYNIAHYGQKSYNGVAILSKYPLEDITRGLPGGTGEDEARYLEAVVGDTRIISVYVPNGQAVGSEKYAYKLAFFKRLESHLAGLLKHKEKLIMGGDFNVAPTDNDVYDPVGWKGAVLVSPEERAHFQSLMDLGLADAWILKHGQEKGYTWWDYRMGSFQRDHGLRIDHFLVSSQAAACLKDMAIHRDIRALERPSDHAPVWCEFK